MTPIARQGSTRHRSGYSTGDPSKHAVKGVSGPIPGIAWLPHAAHAWVPVLPVSARAQPSERRGASDRHSAKILIFCRISILAALHRFFTPVQVMETVSNYRRSYRHPAILLDRVHGCRRSIVLPISCFCSRKQSKPVRVTLLLCSTTSLPPLHRVPSKLPILSPPRPSACCTCCPRRTSRNGPP